MLKDINKNLIHSLKISILLNILFRIFATIIKYFQMSGSEDQNNSNEKELNRDGIYEIVSDRATLSPLAQGGSEATNKTKIDFGNKQFGFN